jgi:hypothetical protein
MAEDITREDDVLAVLRKAVSHTCAVPADCGTADELIAATRHETCRIIEVQ